MNAFCIAHVEPDDNFTAWDPHRAGHPFRTPINDHTPPPRHGREDSMRVLPGLPSESRKQRVAQLETNLLELLAEMASSPVEAVEPKMGLGLKCVCEVFGLQWAALWTKSLIDPTFLVPMHYWSNDASLERCTSQELDRIDLAGPHSPKPVVHGETLYPWITVQVQSGNLVAFHRIDSLPAEAALDKAALLAAGIQSGLIIPLRNEKEVLGAVSFGMSSGENCWPEALVNRLRGVAGIFAHMAARKVLEERLRASEEQLGKAEGELRLLKERLEAESDCLRAEVHGVHPHEKIIGRGSGIKRVLRLAEQVAPADCSVLITGETGTGKELVAHEIHGLSRRKDRALVMVNCAALPSELVESELFGRERGAYTGALSSQIGRFEVANGSTIFLDEVGELPLGVQAKLLRVLQQGEFQRLGSPKTHKVNVRIIAATNRNLAEEVRKGKFREDLYYRLRVFPIELPPLRERAEDIPELVFAFMQEFATRMGKKITKVPRKSMELLQSHRWPGNIRELRNAIEHSVILTSGDILKLTLLNESPEREAPTATLAEVEREYILKTLESTGWRIKGPYGAATRLDLEPSTLYSRMQRLGIPHRRQREESSMRA